jgi:hypothetical protein
MATKRQSPIALSLLKNSMSAMYAAIEIHNKPKISYRYELVVILVINAWELLLKAFVYKFISTKKVFCELDRTISFKDSVEIVRNHFGKQYLTLCENLNAICRYRDQISHFHIRDLDIIIFGLIKKSIQFYDDFVKLHFSMDLSKESDLILLPLAFKKLYSPVDFLSNESSIKNYSSDTKRFIESIINSTKLLASHGIEDSILVDFKMGLINVNNIKNADIIAGIDNTQKNVPIYTINKEPSKVFITSEDAQQLTLTPEVDKTKGILIHEELSDHLFDEINNVVNSNILLTRGKKSFVLGEKVYYRIYSERKNVVNLNDNILTLSNGGYDLYAPFLFWINQLKPKAIAFLLHDLWMKCKHPGVFNLFTLSILLGKNTSALVFELLERRYCKFVQKPNYFYTFQKALKSKKQSDIRLMAMRGSENKSITLTNQKQPVTLKFLFNNEKDVSNALSNECMEYFNGSNVDKSTIRTLDIIENGIQISDKGEKVYEELLKLK